MMSLKTHPRMCAHVFERLEGINNGYFQVFGKQIILLSFIISYMLYLFYINYLYNHMKWELLLLFSHSNTLAMSYICATISKSLSSPSHIFRNCKTILNIFSSFCINLCKDILCLQTKAVSFRLLFLFLSRLQNFENIISLILVPLQFLSQVQHIEDISLKVYLIYFTHKFQLVQ